MDLNHDKENQNLSCYHYTIGQSVNLFEQFKVLGGFPGDYRILRGGMFGREIKLKEDALLVANCVEALIS
jgi:hypothetical protein